MRQGSLMRRLGVQSVTVAAVMFGAIVVYTPLASAQVLEGDRPGMIIAPGPDGYGGGSDEDVLQSLSGAWTGVYMGAFGSYRFYTLDMHLRHTSASQTLTSDTYHVAPGVFAGFNLQVDTWLVGAEVDYAYLPAITDPELPNIGDAHVNTDMYAHIRGRFGFTPTDKLMLFVAGGLAYTRYNILLRRQDASTPPVPEIARGDRWFSGYTVGAGAAFAFTPNIVAQAEYLFDYYPQEKEFEVLKLYGPSGTVDYNSKVIKGLVHTGRVGLAVKF